MSQSAKPTAPQALSPRRGRAGVLGVDAIAFADAALKRAGFADATLVLRWAEIVGPEIARVAEPIRYQEGPNGAALTLKCEAAASVFLQHETRALTERLNAYLGPGRIARIRLVPGRLEGAPPLADHPRRNVRLPPQDEAVADLTGALAHMASLRRNFRK